MANRNCNLECEEPVYEEDEIVEFVGPVKITLVNQPKSSYRNKVCQAASIVLAQMAMAIVFFFVTFYSLSYKKKDYMKALHIFLCTSGLQLLIPFGVLTVNGLNGAAGPMNTKDRRSEHGVTQIFGLVISTAGSAASFFAEYPKIITVHSILGFGANVLALLSALVGILVYFFCNILYLDTYKTPKLVFIYIHYTLGVLTIIISSTCFVSGIINDSFMEWFPAEEMMYFLCIFSIFYTCVVIYKPLQFSKSGLNNKKIK